MNRTTARKNFAIIYMGMTYTKVFHESAEAAKDWACDHFGFKPEEIDAIPA